MTPGEYIAFVPEPYGYEMNYDPEVCSCDAGCRCPDRVHEFERQQPLQRIRPGNESQPTEPRAVGQRWAAAAVYISAAAVVAAERIAQSWPFRRRNSKSESHFDVVAYVTLICACFAASCVPAAAVEMPRVIRGFTIERIATVEGARELAATPSGDVIVGTGGSNVYIVPNADGTPKTPHIFATFDDEPAAGVALGQDALFVGTQFGVYRVAYRAGDEHARTAPEKLASVRTSRTSGAHVTTSVAFAKDTLYASVGSSCNACHDVDETRASIQRIDVTTHKMSPFADHIRNAIALAFDPETAHLWAGVAGVDDLAVGHPYEIFDDVSAHDVPVDYGWPTCYENRRIAPNWPGTCSAAAVPRVVFPAYETPIGAVFYPQRPNGRYAFPARYRGGAFVTLHGSWHGPSNGLSGYMPPRVVFVPLHGDTPLRAVDWNDPTMQWSEFIGGYQNGGTIDRIGRPTGITVGPDGSLFVADDMTGAIYRIRPAQ